MPRLCAILLALAGPRIAAAQPPAPAAPEPPPALPAGNDVTDRTDNTDTGLLQVELGGVFTRTTRAIRAAGTPFTLRYGAFDWLEVSAGTDGYLQQRTPETGAASGLGNTLLGARVRLFPRPGGLPILSLLPQVVLPTASTDDGLGTGDLDATLAVVTGRDLPRGSHVDVSYGLGSIGGGDAGARFVQHAAFVSGTFGVTRAWTPGLTLAWLSRQDPVTGGALTAAADSVLTVSRRVALDLSVLVGLNRHAPDVEVAAGVSVVVGELDLDDGVHARRHRLRLRPRPRPRPLQTPAAR